MNLETLPKPQRVSPLIKLTRWTLLLCGIYYGWQKWHYYHDYQERLREERFKVWPSLHQQEEAVRLAALIADYRQVAEALDIYLPPDWKPTF